MKKRVCLESDLMTVVFFIPNTLESSIVHRVFKLEHEISLFLDFYPIQMALVFPKFCFNPDYFENSK